MDSHQPTLNQSSHPNGRKSPSEKVVHCFQAAWRAHTRARTQSGRHLPANHVLYPFLASSVQMSRFLYVCACRLCACTCFRPVTFSAEQLLLCEAPHPVCLFARGTMRLSPCYTIGLLLLKSLACTHLTSGYFGEDHVTLTVMIHMHCREISLVSSRLFDVSSDQYWEHDLSAMGSSCKLPVSSSTSSNGKDEKLREA